MTLPYTLPCKPDTAGYKKAKEEIKKLQEEAKKELIIAQSGRKVGRSPVFAYLYGAKAGKSGTLYADLGTISKNDYIIYEDEIQFFSKEAFEKAQQLFLDKYKWPDNIEEHTERKETSLQPTNPYFKKESWRK